MTIDDRQQGWLAADFIVAFRAILHRATTQYHVAVPAYCLMPDHLHFLAAGLSPKSDQLLWARSIRRSINALLPPPFRLQKQGYDHVLRPTERGHDAFAMLVHYICANPVRANLTLCPENWPYTGAVVPALPELDPRQTDYCDRWWSYWNSLP